MIRGESELDSFAKANLSVICGSLLTIKLFLSQVFPNLLATRSSKSRSDRHTTANPSDVVTFGGGGGGTEGDGSKRRRDKYSKSDEEDMFPLTTRVNVESGTNVSLHRSGYAGDMSDHSAGRGDDAESTTAIVPGGGKIVQTRATVASYEPR